MVFQRSIFPAVLMALAGALSAQTVYVVAATGGPGADFSTIGEAIDAADDGDIILIRASIFEGGYFPEDLVIDGKSLVIQEHQNAEISVNGMTIRNLRSTQSVAVRGLEFSWDVELLDNEGTVWLEETIGAIRVANSASVSIARSVMEDHFAGLLATDSAVYVYDSEVRNLGHGYPGARLVDSFLLLQGSFVEARDGVVCYNPFLCDCSGFDATGGDGIQARGSSHVVVVDSEVHAGRKGACWQDGSNGDGEEFALLDSAELTLTSALARSLTARSPVYESSHGLSYMGRSGDIVYLLLSGRPAPGFQIVGVTGSPILHLGDPILKVRSGPGAARLVTGELTFAFGPFDLSAAGRSFYAQALYINGAERGFSSPTHFHLVGDSAAIQDRPDSSTREHSSGVR